MKISLNTEHEFKYGAITLLRPNPSHHQPWMGINEFISSHVNDSDDEFISHFSKEYNIPKEMITIIVLREKGIIKSISLNLRRS